MKIGKIIKVFGSYLYSYNIESKEKFIFLLKKKNRIDKISQE